MNVKEIKTQNKYITTQEALCRCKEAGLGKEGKGICIVTLHRLAKERGFLYQPRGKRGQCFIIKELFDKFLEAA
jgi:hypothetical protein